METSTFSSPTSSPHCDANTSTSSSPSTPKITNRSTSTSRNIKNNYLPPSGSRSASTTTPITMISGEHTGATGATCTDFDDSNFERCFSAGLDLSEFETCTQSPSNNTSSGANMKLPQSILSASAQLLSQKQKELQTKRHDELEEMQMYQNAKVKKEIEEQRLEKDLSLHQYGFVVPSIATSQHQQQGVKNAPIHHLPPSIHNSNDTSGMEFINH